MNVKDAVLNSVVKLPQDDVVHLNNAHATAKHDDPTKMNDVEIPPKNERRGAANANGETFIRTSKKKSKLTIKCDKNKRFKLQHRFRWRILFTPDDEEEFLIKDFDDQYQSLQAERLHAMTKSELVEEYLLLESRVEILTKRLRNRMVNADSDKNEETSNQENDFQKEIERYE
ncbi:hexamethylene bisacetamide inducible 1 [Holotrichia oblita]|uniref:Hexamethylene bisacetamide inducible 1 n=1 Tax=Holotrichia oblita TaxID=644536 RepID=A0ACB9TJR0_HOLOL|nr:hexamethylene bisacetamide inducible 1 [Holotrichia oblita]